MIEGFLYFPTIIYRDEHPEWVNLISKYTEKYFENKLNNSFIHQTTCIIGDSNLTFFVDYLIQTGKNVLSNQGYAIEKYELYLSGLWGQEIEKDGGTNIHLHKNSQLCGWFFLEAPEGGSYPIYYDTRMNKPIIELDYKQENEITTATSSVHFNNVLPGTVLLSNSWVPHQLSVNTVKTTTKVVHFIISHKDKLCNIF